MELQEKLKKYSERVGEEKAKEYARSLGGFPKGMTLASVNGHTRGWDEGFTAAVELLGGAIPALEWIFEHNGGDPNDIYVMKAEKALAAIERKLEER